jgi:hypothetical protein
MKWLCKFAAFGSTEIKTTTLGQLAEGFFIDILQAAR